jgi:hypothetical protein
MTQQPRINENRSIGDRVSRPDSICTKQQIAKLSNSAASSTVMSIVIWRQDLNLHETNLRQGGYRCISSTHYNTEATSSNLTLQLKLQIKIPNAETLFSSLHKPLQFVD